MFFLVALGTLLGPKKVTVGTKRSSLKAALRPVRHGHFGLCRSSAIPLCLSCTFVRFQTERKMDDLAIPDRRTGHVHNWSCDRNPTERFGATIDTQSIKTHGP